MVWKRGHSSRIGGRTGGLKEAISAAAELAGLENYNLVDYPKYEDDLESIFLDAFTKVKIKLLHHPLEKYASEFIEISQLEGIQTRVPYSIKIE